MLSCRRLESAALTLRGYAEGVAAWYGVEAHLEFLPYDQWREGVPDRDAAVTLAPAPFAELQHCEGAQPFELCAAL